MSGYYYEGLHCVRCPNNHTTPGNPAIYYRSSCFWLPGFERKSDVECMPCKQGFYSSNVGTSCIPSPRGTFVNVDGCIMYTKWSQNWVSLVAASTSCTPCPSTSYSNFQNILCVPGNTLASCGMALNRISGHIIRTLSTKTLIFLHQLVL